MTAPRTTLPPRLPRTASAEDYQNYLRRIADGMRNNGRSGEEIVQFLRHIEGQSEAVKRSLHFEPIAEEPPTPDQLQTFAMHALQGLSFGFGDEAIGTVLDLATGKKGNVEEYRRQLAAGQAAAPGTALAGEVSGALSTGGAALGRLGLRMLSPFARR